MKTEYEYSFKVENIEPYIEFCKNKGFLQKEKTYQIITFYRNKNKTKARITTNVINNQKRTYLDFKDDNQQDIVLKISRETIPIGFFVK